MELFRDIFHGITNEEDDATFCTANSVVDQYQQRDAGYVMQQGTCLGGQSVKAIKQNIVNLVLFYEQQYVEDD